MDGKLLKIMIIEFKIGGKHTFCESHRRSKIPALRDAAAAVCWLAALALEEP